MDDNWDTNFDYDSEMDGTWNSKEIEIYLTTYDGAQHLLLHGWLKKNRVTIKMEHHASKGDGHFGGFTAHISESFLEKLKEDNLENGLFTDIEIISKIDTKTFSMDNIIKLDEGIKDFLFDIAGNISSPEDISRFVGKANETTVKLFKQDQSYITEYIETNEMSYDNKIKDLNILIEYFEEQERYEDCALLVEVKSKVQTRELLLKIQGNE
tara:strand:+ start:137 stop:769 length:633 start_codon:yes stop_codon:yes gene_type:complete